MRLLVILVVMFFNIGYAENSSWYEDSKRGFNWFEENPVGKKPVVKKKKQKDIDYVKVVKGWKRKHDFLLNKALVTESPSDVAAYIRFKRILILKAEKFSDLWQLAIAQEPSLDFATKNPISTLGREVTEHYQTKETDSTIKGLARTHGLIFFYSGNCQYCHAMSSVVKRFSDRYGWDVVAISKDGGGLPEFPNYVVDGGHFKMFNVDTWPSLMAYSEKDGWIPLAVGVQTEDQIKDRIMLFKKYGKGGIR